MSANGWDSWAASALNAGNNKAADHAGVFGLDGTCWGATDEVARALPKDFFQNVNCIMSGGAGAGKLACNGKSYITIRSDQGAVLAKCGTGGISVCKGKQSFVVGMYDGDSVQPNNNFLATSVTCDRLKESGY